jgi:hypothetical protein
MTYSSVPFIVLKLYSRYVDFYLFWQYDSDVINTDLNSSVSVRWSIIA